MENETKVVFVVPCTACRALNRLEATFKAAPAIEKPEAKPEAEKPKEAEKDGREHAKEPEGGSVQPDKAQGKPATAGAEDKRADRKPSAKDTGSGGK